MRWDIYTFIRAASEVSATTLLIMVGCMGEVMHKDKAGTLEGLHQGLMVMVLVHIFGLLSGAHANPCVTFSCYLMGYIAHDFMLMYVACQLTGAGLGYYLLMMALPQELVTKQKPAVCLIAPLKSLTGPQVVGIECLLTSVYLLGWCAMWDVRSGRFLDSVSIRMGLLVTVCSFAGVKLTGASMNPVKTLVPSLFLGNPGLVWMQLTGQVLASIIVPLVWSNAFMPYRCRYRHLEMHI